MTILEFEQSLNENEPPAKLPALVAALWWDTRGNWEKAHTIAQEDESSEGAWVHGYLHLREGDQGNAGYWYRRAGRSLPQGALDVERHAIVVSLLGA